MYFMKEFSCSTDGPFKDCIRFIFNIDSEFYFGVVCCIFWLIVISILIVIILYFFKWLEPIFDMRREYVKKQEKKFKKKE